MILGIAIASIVISISYLQISTLQDQNKVINETNQRLEVNLTNYQDLFGSIPKNYTSLPFVLQTHVYIAQAITPEPVTKVRVNQPYQVVANITKMENTQPLIYYYCLVQVTNSTDLDYHIGWGQGIFIPKQTFSQCAISWMPTAPGNYTITAFAWRSLMGSPLANAVQVMSKYYHLLITIQFLCNMKMGHTQVFHLTIQLQETTKCSVLPLTTNQMLSSCQYMLQKMVT